MNEATTDLLLLGYEVNMSGRAEEFAKTAYYLLFAFVEAIILVYMVRVQTATRRWLSL